MLLEHYVDSIMIYVCTINVLGFFLARKIVLFSILVRIAITIHFKRNNFESTIFWSLCYLDVIDGNVHAIVLYIRSRVNYGLVLNHLLSLCGCTRAVLVYMYFV